MGDLACSYRGTERVSVLAAARRPFIAAAIFFLAPTLIFRTAGLRLPACALAFTHRGGAAAAIFALAAELIRRFAFFAGFIFDS